MSKNGVRGLCFYIQSGVNQINNVPFSSSFPHRKTLSKSPTGMRTTDPSRKRRLPRIPVLRRICKKTRFV